MDNELEYSHETEKEQGEGVLDPNQEPPKPVGPKEWLLRAGGLVNIAVQAVNISLAYSTGLTRLALQGPSATLQAGQACTYASSGLGIVNSPIVVYKERQLTKEDTFRAALNGIRDQQGRLAEQNHILCAEIDDLESEVRRMQDIEMALKELSEVQGTQINELLDLVRQNKEINEGMRYVLKNKVLEEVISLVLNIDNDGSFTIQNNEIERLIIGMKLIDEIKFDEHAFKTDVIACGGNVDEVIMIIKRMFHGGAEGEEGRETACQIEIEDPEDWFQKQKGGGSGSGRR